MMNSSRSKSVVSCLLCRIKDDSNTHGRNLETLRWKVIIFLPNKREAKEPFFSSYLPFPLVLLRCFNKFFTMSLITTASLPSAGIPAPSPQLHYAPLSNGRVNFYLLCNSLLSIVFPQLLPPLLAVSGKVSVHCYLSLLFTPSHLFSRRGMSSFSLFCVFLYCVCLATLIFPSLSSIFSHKTLDLFP